MPAQADPDLALKLAQATADLYGQAVERLLAMVARRLAQGIEQPGWAEGKLAQLTVLRNDAQRVVAALEADAPGVVAEAVRRAWEAGQKAAATEVTGGIAIATNTAAVDRLVAEAVQQVTSTHPQILRSTIDVYRQVIQQASGQTVAGAATRRQAAQQALNRFANEGIVGFIDSKGRRWGLDSYAEMATRTATGRAQVAGTLDRFEADGRDLVIVSDAPQECKACRPWEGRVLSISGTDPKYPSLKAAQSAGLLHANCFPGEVLASGPAPEAGYSRWYEGDLVVIHTAAGVELPVTPNHPVLTSEGWVAAGQIRVGMHVIRKGSEVDGPRVEAPDDEQVPARIGEVVGALRESVKVPAVRVPAAPEQFHGDGSIDGEVEVVRADGLLGDDDVSGLCDECGQRKLLVGGMGLGALLPEGPAGEVFGGAPHASDGIVGVRDLHRTLSRAHGSPLPGLGLAPADLSAPDLDPSADRRLGDAEGGRQLVLALAGSVTLDEVVDLGSRQFAGHVYNLQTAPGWYVANGIVVHNCRHRLGAYIPGVTKRLTDTADPAGDQARREQRRLERGVRQWKQRAAASLDDDTRRQCERRARDWQARLREHVQANDLKRQPARERLGAR